MKESTLELHGTQITVGKNLNFEASLSRFTKKHQSIVIVTDENVAKSLEVFLQKFTKIFTNTHLIKVESGEKSKCRKVKADIENEMFEKKLGRDTLLIACGGGVVTDLAGFVAATYCRGVSFISIPTTVLGMVDASIGGKTGINVKYGKNLLGAFYHPLEIFCDTHLLKTLPRDQWCTGFMETVKAALIYDRELFYEIEKKKEKVFDSEHIGFFIEKSIRVKIDVVKEDEKELQGKRRILNFGHTIGHAIESYYHYKMSHGQAIALGMIVEGYISYKMGLIDLGVIKRIRDVIMSFSLSTTLPKEINIDELIPFMVIDKKALGQKPRFVLLNDIGSVEPYKGTYCTQVDEILIKDAINYIQE